jgi:hypothetical protein
MNCRIRDEFYGRKFGVEVTTCISVHRLLCSTLCSALFRLRTFIVSFGFFERVLRSVHYFILVNLVYLDFT